MSFRKELEELINKYSLESGSDTPDFLLANYLEDALMVFNWAVTRREAWYGRHTSSCQCGLCAGTNTTLTS